MIIGYARVSSREQAENSHALEQQIERLKAAGADKVLLDVDSGSKDERPSFLTLMSYCCSGVCNTVIVTRLDRLTRSLPTLRKTIAQLEAVGVGLIALDDSINTATAAGKFQINILGALAEMEVDRLSERVKHGWQHLRDRKVAMNPPFGYCKDNDRHSLDHSPFLCLVDQQVELSKVQIARDIVQAFLSKKTLRLALRHINQKYGIQTFAHNDGNHQKGGRVAREMFRFSPGGLSNWLTNPVLQGHLCYLRGSDRQQITYNTHEPLITSEEAREIELILDHNRQVRGYGSTAQEYPLSGLVFCGECRGACYSTSGNRGKTPGYNHYFQCKNWRVRSCSQKQMIRMEQVEAAVIDALLTRVDQIATLALTPEQSTESPELLALKTELAYYQSAPGDRAAGIVAELQNQISALKQQGFQAFSVQGANRELLLKCFSDRQTWQLLISPEEKRQIYRSLVERVMIRDGVVQSVTLKV